MTQSEVDPPPKHLSKKEKLAAKKEKLRAKVGSFKCPKVTPDGDPICFRYNSMSGCKTSKCKFKHCCGVCFQAGHPWFKHPSDTQG